MNEGMIGLTGLSRDRNQAQQDLAILETMDQKRKSDQQQEFQAQQIQQAIQERTLAAADQLLEKDRAKINKKIILNQRQITEHLDKYGGSKAEFMANGGMSVMGNMQTDILASEEFGMYKSNKENLARIYEAQEKKLGHLLSPKDIQSIKDYQNNPEGGRISYSGMMAEVEIPHDKFEIGQEIHPYYIMSHGGNLAKIMSNYEMVHPDRPKPEKNEKGQLTEKGREEVVAFMKEMGYGGMGQSAALLNKRIAEEKARREYEKQTDPYKDEKATYLGGVKSLQQQLPKDLKAGDITHNYMNDLMKSDGGDQFAALYGDEFNKKAKNRSNSHVRSLFNPLEGIGEIMDSFRGELSLRGSRRLGLTQRDQNVLIREFIPELQEGQNVIKDFKPDETFYKADGSKMTDNFAGNLDVDDHKGEWKILGVTTMFKSVVKDQAQGGEDKEILLIDAYDGEEFDQEATDKMYANIETSDAQLGYVIPMENDKGDIIYKEIDLSDPGIEAKLAKMLPANNLKDIVQEDRYKNNKRLEYQALDDQENIQVQTSHEILKPVFQSPIFKSEAANYYGTNSGGQLNRYDLQKSFYMAFDMTMSQLNTGKGSIKDERVRSYVDQQAFSAMMQRGEVQEDLLNYDLSPEEIINKWIENENAGQSDEHAARNTAFAQRWLQYLKTL